jgi:hypothetical protein
LKLPEGKERKNKILITISLIEMARQWTQQLREMDTLLNQQKVNSIRMELLDTDGFNSILSSPLFPISLFYDFSSSPTFSNVVV